MVANVSTSSQTTLGAQHSLIATLLYCLKTSTFVFDALVGAYVLYQSKKIQKTLQEGLLGEVAQERKNVPSFLDAKLDNC